MPYENKEISTGSERNLLLNRIQAHADQLTDGQRLIADYLIHDYHRGAFMTAAALGRQVGISESTVVRFATSLGYSGYPEMQQDLQQMVREKLTTVDRLLGTVQDVGDTDSLVYSLLRAEIDNLTQTIQELPMTQFQAAVSYICAADTVWVVGYRSAWSVAFYLGFNLSWVLPNVRMVIADQGEPFEQLMHVSARDVVIGVSFPRYTMRTMEALTFAHQQGARIIVITDGVISPLARVADVLLPARSSLKSFADSLTAPVALAYALVTCVSVTARERTEVKLQEMEALWRKHGLFWPGKTN